MKNFLQKLFPERFSKSTNKVESNNLLLDWVEHKNYDSYTKIYDLYYKNIFLFARRMTNITEAEDIVQDTFKVLVEQRENFRKVKNLEKYLIGIAMNCIKELYDLKNNEFKYNVSLEEIDTVNLKSNHNPFEEIVFKEKKELWWKAVQQLNPKYRLIYLLGFAGFTSEEIAEKLEITKKAAINIIHRSNNQIEECFQKMLRE